MRGVTYTTPPTKLSSSTLEQLTIPHPSYDRAKVQIGIVHFGVGGFHRAHQAMYVDKLLEMGLASEWGICGVGLLANDRRMAEVMEAQDGLYTLLLEHPDGHREARVIGSIVDYRYAPDDQEGVIELLAAPTTKIISMTITEGGYYIDSAPEINVFGLVTEALVRRRDRGIGSPTIVSCDNIEGNGDVARKAFTTYAERVHPGLGEWMSANTRFPNSMVDRITPATSDRERAILAKEFGVEDNWPVFCEPFRQWVLEDRFTDDRPPLEKVGVQFVPDVSPYELMKIRILNGGHAAIAYPAGLMDIHFVHEAMAEPLVRGFLDKIEHDEIVPTVPPVPDTSLEDYYRLIERRFANPKIGDTVRRLCLDGSNRQPKFIIPTIADRLKAGEGVAGLALESALWCRYCHGTTDSGAVIEPNDPNWDRMQATARKAKDDPSAWLAMEDIYGEVGRSAVFADAFGKALNALWKDGARATLERYLAG